MKNKDEIEDYLWDRGDPVDPGVRRLEQLLSRFAFAGDPAPAFQREASHASEAKPRRALVLALAASVLTVLSLGTWFLLRKEPAPRGYVVEGHPTQRFVREGEWVETGREENALLEIADIGTVDLGSQARLCVQRSTLDGHRLFLERGRLSAAISAAPEVFQVGTPAGLSIDLGCLYELAVDADGTTHIAVTSGAVSFDGADRHVIVPRDAKTRATRARGPSSPVWGDATEELQARVEALEFAESPPAEEIADLLGKLTSLTLWHLLQAHSMELRAGAYDALVAQAGAPAGLDRARILAGERAERERWLSELSWYRTRFAAKVRR